PRAAPTKESRLHGREFDPEGATAGNVADGNLTVVGLDHTTGDRESEATAAVGWCALYVAAPADVEDASQVVLGDAAAAVGHREPDPPVGFAVDSERHGPTGRGVTDRVADEVRHSAGQLVRIPLYGEPILIRRCRHRQPYAGSPRMLG